MENSVEISLNNKDRITTWFHHGQVCVYPERDKNQYFEDTFVLQCYCSHIYNNQCMKSTLVFSRQEWIRRWYIHTVK